MIKEKKCPNCGSVGETIAIPSALGGGNFIKCSGTCGMALFERVWDNLAAKMEELERFQNNVWTGYEITAAKFKAQRFNPYFGDTEKQKLQEENQQLKAELDESKRLLYESEKFRECLAGELKARTR